MDNNIADIETNSQTENKDFLSKLVEQLEGLIEQDINLPFHLKQIKDNGFLIKVRGLLAFLSYDYMPWRYNDKDCWKAVFKSIKGKQFYGRVYQLQKDPLFIIFNAQVPQFKPIDLTEGEKYKGLIIKKNQRTLLVDIGHHFRWKCGSVVGLLHESQLPRNQKMSELIEGDEIETTYLGINEKNQIVFCNNIFHLNWNKNNLKYSEGEIVKAEIVEIKKNGQTKLIVEDTYNAILLSIKEGYPPRSQNRIKQLQSKFKTGDIIHCEIIEANNRKRLFILKWIPKMDTEVVLVNSIINKLDKNTISKLSSIFVD